MWRIIANVPVLLLKSFFEQFLTSLLFHRNSQFITSLFGYRKLLCNEIARHSVKVFYKHP